MLALRELEWAATGSADAHEPALGWPAPIRFFAGAGRYGAGSGPGLGAVAARGLGSPALRGGLFCGPWPPPPPPEGRRPASASAGERLRAGASARGARPGPRQAQGAVGCEAPSSNRQQGGTATGDNTAA